MLARISTVVAALALAVQAHAQPPEDLTEQQALELAHETTLRRMSADLSTERALYLSTLLSSPEVADALARDGKYMIDAADISLSGDYTNSASNDRIGVHSGFARTIVAVITCSRFEALEPHKGSGPRDRRHSGSQSEKPGRLRPYPDRAGVSAG